MPLTCITQKAKQAHMTGRSGSDRNWVTSQNCMIDNSRLLKIPSPLRHLLKCLYTGNSWSSGIFYPQTVRNKNSCLLICSDFLIKELFTPSLQLLSDFCFLLGLWRFLLCIVTDLEPPMVWKPAVQMRQHFHFILKNLTALNWICSKAVICSACLMAPVLWFCHQLKGLVSRGAAQVCAEGREDGKEHGPASQRTGWVWALASPAQTTSLWLADMIPPFQT